MMLNLPLIYLTRHGETDWNLTGRYQGHSDICLNENGRLQAVALGRALLTATLRDGLVPSDLAYLTSPLARAVETMAILRDTLGVEAAPATRDPRLVETDYGSWEGLTESEIVARDGALFFARRSDPDTVAPPGGESFGMVRARVLRVLEELKDPTVIVCHAGISSAIRALVLGLDSLAAKRLPVEHRTLYRIYGGRVEAVVAPPRR